MVTLSLFSQNCSGCGSDKRGIGVAEEELRPLLSAKEMPIHNIFNSDRYISYKIQLSFTSNLRQI